MARSESLKGCINTKPEPARPIQQMEIFKNTFGGRLHHFYEPLYKLLYHNSGGDGSAGGTQEEER